MKYIKKTNKNTRKTSVKYVFVNFEHISHIFSSVSVVDFEQVNVSWEVAGATYQSTSNFTNYKSSYLSRQP